jgi:glycosyltransferase involved in cell wall biosynthesis
MIIAIDATTIRSDGGIEYLTQILNNLSNKKSIKKIFVWSAKNNLSLIKINKKIIKKNNFLLNSNFFMILLWQFFFFNYELKQNNCDIIYLTSGYCFAKKNKPRVLIIQNLLPFVKKNKMNFNVLFLFKLFLLKIIYIYFIKNSEGVILSSKYSKKIIKRCVKLKTLNRVIYHGVDKIFFKKPKRLIYYKKRIINLLYVSSLISYKNQLNLIRAVYILICSGFKIKLRLVGSGSYLYKKKLLSNIQKNNLDNSVIFEGNKTKIQMLNLLSNYCDIYIYPSKCESFGISLLEAMANGKVICCSKISTMPELLNNGGFYFNPNLSKSISESIVRAIKYKKLAYNLSCNSFKEAKKFSWKKTSKNTFDFIYEVQKKNTYNKPVFLA